MSVVQTQNDYIPYDLRVRALQVEPRLDIFWQEYLADLFRDISPQYQENINQQVLRHKNILWDKQTQTFEYKEENQTGGGNLSALIATSGNPKIQAFGAKLFEYLETIEKSDNLIEMAEILENAIGQIKDFNVGRNLSLQAIKYKVLKEFIYQSADIIRHKKSSFEIPDNKRRINVEVCKIFINEVYLKHQLLEYSFRTLSHRQLLDFPYPIINDFLHKEQRVRKLHIVRTSRYLFAIAPSLEQTTNPYRIRRFLEEGRLFSRDSWVLKGSFIEIRRLESEKNPAILQSMDEQFRHHIDHIISIESGINPLLIELFEKLEDIHQEQILPLLFKPLTVEMELNEAIDKHLTVYEEFLEEYILIPLKKGLSQLLHNDDECSYAFIAAQQLFSLVINVFDGFMSLPLITGNKVAKKYYERLVAYLVFLSKRRGDIFVKHQESSSFNFAQEKEQQMVEGLNKCREIINDVFSKHYALKQEVAELKQKIDAPQSFFTKLLKKKESWEALHYEKNRQANQISYKTHQELFVLPDKYQNSIVDLDFDAQVEDIENKCRYAFPQGEMGITKLPLLLSFAGSVGEFDLPQFAGQVVPETVYKVTGKQPE